MGEFSLGHIIFVLVIVLVFFGPKRLPQLGSSLGEAIRGFKNAMGGEGGSHNNDQPQQQAQNMAPQIPAHLQNQNQYQNQALHEAPAQQTHDIQNAQFTSTDDKTRNNRG